MLKQLFRKKEIFQTDPESGHSLNKKLGVRDLTGMGIAAIIGAGIFSTIGNASASGGPGVILLFIFTAIACGFSAMAYAEFASRIPLSGSAYTYSYVAFGELMAWIIGWSLIMEYAIGNIAVAISWSDYFTALLSHIKIDSLHINGIHLPEWMTMDFYSAYNAYQKFGANFSYNPGISVAETEACNAWIKAPNLFGLRIILDIPALLIIFIITWLVYRGMEESRKTSNIMVAVKLFIIVFIIIFGAFYIDTTNWNPFAPNGMKGILKGISAVFFAYIGFDALSTTAEECKNPQRDLPKGMIYSIVICTILYVLIALVLTGMVPYSKLAVGDPLAFAFEERGLLWISGIISVSAVIAMASVLLVFQLGQPRIWMSMSRDGLLPKKFSEIHPKYKTPGFATIVTGFVVAIPALFLNLTAVTDLCSIGTLFAFVLVCAGVLAIQDNKDLPPPKFKIPYLNSKYLFPLLTLSTIILLYLAKPEQFKDFFISRKLIPAEQLLNNVPQKTKDEWMFIAQNLHGIAPEYFKTDNPLYEWMDKQSYSKYGTILSEFGLSDKEKYLSSGEVIKNNFPFWIFLFSCLYLSYLSFKKNYSFIPLAGLVCCLYMMCEIGTSNWIGFFIWLIIGLVIYFGYGYKHSRLNKKTATL